MYYGRGLIPAEYRYEVDQFFTNCAYIHDHLPLLT